VKKIFTFPAGGAIVFNLISICCIILFSQQFSIGAIAIGLLAGMFLQVVYLFTRLLPFKPFRAYSGQFSSGELRAIITTAGLLILIELLNRSYFLIDRYFAVRFGDGIISSLNYGQVLVQLPDAVVGFAIASVVFPFFSQLETKESAGAFSALYQNAIIGGTIVALPLAVLFFVNAQEVVSLVLRRGAFDSQSVHLTSNILRPYTPSIVALFVVSSSIRACYARGMVRQVLALTICLLAVKFIGTAVLSQWVGYPGISAATSLSQVAFAAGLVILITRRYLKGEEWYFAGKLMRLVTAALVGLMVAWLLDGSLARLVPGEAFLSIAIRLALSAVVVGVSYILAALALGLKAELSVVVRRQRNRNV
jgi:putative peptidoglycan lipid II flippase